MPAVFQRETGLHPRATLAELNLRKMAIGSAQALSGSSISAVHFE